MRVRRPRPPACLPACCSASQHTAFKLALARHGRVFHLVAKAVKTKSTQQCVAYYYTAWRCTEDGDRSKRGKDAAEKDRRFALELARRDRAWFHFWRFDEEALGPELPPPAIVVEHDGSGGARLDDG